jgi:hypothetical protein
MSVAKNCGQLPAGKLNADSRNEIGLLLNFGLKTEIKRIHDPTREAWLKLKSPTGLIVKILIILSILSKIGMRNSSCWVLNQAQSVRQLSHRGYALA